jgi:putative ABC transport system substrate-binding protein
MELLRDAVPSTARVGIVTDSTNPSAADQLRETEAAGRTLGLETIALDVRGPDGIDGVLLTAGRERIDAVSGLAIQMLPKEYTRLAEFSTTSRLPSVFALRRAVELGGLMAYGPNQLAMIRRSAAYVDKILKGAKPADLPIEQPMTFDFVVNMKTARELGITLPNEIMLQVTEVIE